ncbi:phosphotransferase enzyme family protein [Neobacillus sp. K501]
MKEVQISKLYNVNAKKLVLINDGFHNTVYTDQNIILRISDSRRRSLAELEAELQFIKVLGKYDLPVAKPLKSIYGNWIETINKQYRVVAFERVEGKPVDVMDDTVWNAQLFYQWGNVIGKMHSAVKHLKLSRPEWTAKEPDVLNLLPKIASEQVKEQYIKLLTSLKNFDKNTDLFGLIHNDFHQGNIFVNEGKMTIFDFDDCAYHWFAYDLAVSYYHAYWQATAFTPEKTEFSTVFWDNFLSGYKQARPINKEMILQIPIFLKIREIFLYVLFLEKWDMSHLEGWQKYTLTELKQNIENGSPYSNFDFSTLF